MNAPVAHIVESLLADKLLEQIEEIEEPATVE